MIAELGQLALLFALVIAGWQALLPWLAGGEITGEGGRSRIVSCGNFRDDRAPGSALPYRLTRTLVYSQLAFISLSFLILTFCFVSDDFSVAYVANNSDISLPLGYKISAVWGAHEGSLLLWMLLLSVWMAVAVKRSARMPQDFLLWMHSVLGMLSLGFLGFIIFTSNPFLRLLPYPPLHGADLNPLLQDFGLIVHPPILYSGYVGFAIAFAFAMAALLTGRLDSELIKWLRPMTLVAWAMLTLGITLGSWWAYYELGWGGWWFWDPVENASLMPWLVGTALIHALIALEKQGLFKKWTLLLAIFAFALSLFGTFLVRSGVLTSVHAFASDPTRGAYILLYLAVAVGGALTVFATRAHIFAETDRLSLLSRPGFMLLGNIILAAMAATVLLGTVYPLILDALGLGKISVGPPYFNRVILPMVVVLMLAMTIVPRMDWRAMLPTSWRQSFMFAGGGLVLAIALPKLFAGSLSWVVVLGLALSLWLATATIKLAYQNFRKQGLQGGWLGMVLAHSGMAVLAIGVTLTANYSVNQDLRFQLHQTQTVAGYDFTFTGLQGINGANYNGVRGLFEVRQNDMLVAVLAPEKRVYTVKKMPLSETAIAVGWWRDLYVALGEPMAKDAWSVRVYYKPFVRWLWLGGLMMLAGGLVAAASRRQRSRG